MIYRFMLKSTFKVAHIKIATVWPSFLFVLEAICNTCKYSLQVVQILALYYKQLIDRQFSIMRISGSLK